MMHFMINKSYNSSQLNHNPGSHSSRWRFICSHHHRFWDRGGSFGNRNYTLSEINRMIKSHHR